MTSTIVPPVDLAPGMPSRVVTISATDVTEGGRSLEGQMVRFALSDTLDVSSGGDVIAKTQAEVVLDSNGEGSIRLPVYDDGVKTWCGQDWAILVTATWGSQKAIRVPAGTSSIALSALPPVRPLRGREKLWAITGASITVSEGATAGGSVSLNGGVLDLSLTIPRGDFKQAPLIAGDDANDITVPGSYPINSSAVLNTPGPYVGDLTAAGSSTYRVQVFTTWESVPQMFARRYLGGWTQWESLSFRRSNAKKDENLDGRTEAGLTVVSTTVENGPGVTGSLFTLSPELQLYVTREATPRLFLRSMTGGAFNPWQKVGELGDLPQRVAALEASGGGGGDGGAGPGVHQRLVRESMMRRRLGRIRTGGKAAVCMIFDHGTANFRDVILPLLRQYDMPATLALNGGMFDDGYMHAGTNGDVTWTDIKSWMNSDNIEIANHTYTHRGATGIPAMTHEIVEGREKLEAELGTTIDSFVQIGVPSGDPDYDGFGIGLTPEAYYNTVAGKLILDAHPCVSGSIPSNRQTYPLDGTIPIGVGGRWLDSGTPEAISLVEDRIDGAVSRTERVIVRMHPHALTIPDSITPDTFGQFITDLAARRDSGELVILPFNEWSIADQ